MVKKRLLPLIVWGFAIYWSLYAPPLFAGGKADPDLSGADALIAEKQYDEAIRILSNLSRRNPDNFSKAQIRLQKIYRIREEYNTVADELLNVVMAENIDNEKVLALIARLEELESSTNPTVRDFITRIHKLSLFNYNRQRLNRILVQGRGQLDLENYEGALQTYYSGMDMYRNDFFEAGYGGIIEERVNWGIDNIDIAVDSFPRTAAPVGQVGTEIVQAVNQNAPSARIDELYNRLNGTMDNYIYLQQLLYKTCAYFDEQLQKFQQEDSTIGDRNFLSFASRLIQGRAGETIQEGMLGALEGYWNKTVGRVAAVIQNRTDSIYAEGFSSASNRRFSAARQNFVDAMDYCRFPISLIIKNRELKDGGNPKTIRLFDQNILSENLEVYLKYESMGESIRYLLQGSAIGMNLEAFYGIEKDSVGRWRSGTITANAAMRSEQDIQTTLEAMNKEIDALLVQADQKETELKDYRAEAEKIGQSNIDFLEYIHNAQAFIGNLRSLVLIEQINSSVRYYAVANGELEKRLAGRKEQYAEGERLIAGVTKTTDNGTTVTEFYPAEGLAILSAMIQQLTGDSREADNVLARYNAESKELASNPTITIQRNSAQSMKNELAALLAGGQNLSAAARSQITQAEAYRLDGQRYYREAQAALSRQNFDIARDRITNAAKQYNSSLAVQESALIRNELYPQLVLLGQEINRIENEVVIRDVRELVTNARNAYFTGNLERAEEMLIRAQNRWHVTNSDNDEEVDYWLNIIRGAVSLRLGRVIPPTAPLYPEMSQLLSEARKDYDEGIKFLNAGQRALGIAKFNDARQKTREVKLMFPVNQEAGMLELMMDQVIDPRAFEADFERRLRAAIAGTERRSIESFADLQNLADINPKYPDMAGIIYRAEVAIGVRPPPPDPRAIARSNELTQSAQRILDGNVTTQFEVALTQINQAISLNPANALATSIKDRLLYRISRPNAIVMNSQDEAAYNQALIEYQQGNFIIVMAIVQRLLQNPQYRNIAKILELQRRVQNLL